MMIMLTFIAAFNSFNLAVPHLATQPRNITVVPTEVLDIPQDRMGALVLSTEPHHVDSLLRLG